MDGTSRDPQSLADTVRHFAARHGLSPEAEAELATIVERPEDPPDDTRLERPAKVAKRAGAPAFTHVRYEDRGRISFGGMGEVRRALDRVLLREVAVKLIRPALMERPTIVARFRREARITARLQHPSIVSVFDQGVLDDGRPFFAMREVRGESFHGMITRVHLELADAPHWGPDQQQALRRLVSVFERVCEAMAFAHAHGVVHRDLKPSNVLVGELGDVQVVDWGLAKVLPRAGDVEGGDEAPEAPILVEVFLSEDAHATADGIIVGTPAYMPPETAAGAKDAGPRGDVYSLGAVLYTILSGRAPFDGESGREVIDRVRSSTPEPLVREDGARVGPADSLPPVSGQRLPPALVRLTEEAMARDPAARPADAGAVLERVQQWLDGAEKHARAMRLVERAREKAPEAEALREVGRELRARARARMSKVEPWRASPEKAEAWELEDRADRCFAEADDLDLATERTLHAALTHAPDLVEAQEELAVRYRARHAAAERSRDRVEILRTEARLHELAEALPEASERRRDVIAYLRGEGRLTLITEPPGVRARLLRFETRGRRRVAIPDRDLGLTPVLRAPLAMGSYLVALDAGDGRTLTYPVRIARMMHWDGTPPDADAPAPIRIPPREGWADDDRWVPAGWFEAGGDDAAPGALPRRRLWVDDFVIKRDPVTVREYKRFLDALVTEGRTEEALEHVPREKGTPPDHPSAAFRLAGRWFERAPDADGDVWELDWPVLLVSWLDAVAYATWFAEHTGRPWRLPSEYEWEKAARGVDGRFFPWGDHLDPAQCCVRASHAGRPMPARVDAYPGDVSVYGVRGLGGNVRDWCADVHRPEGPPTDGERARRPDLADAPPTAGRVDRGGTWGNHELDARSAFRRWSDPTYRYYVLGFRLARSL
ncbi:MAG: bifunctional serine/threonine-protein kinase/formylglycine-generating enzyme family protein [Sandaracinaceae bacterium]